MLFLVLAFIVLLIIDLIVAVWYTREGFPDLTVKSFWLKMLASAIFVGFGAFAYMISEKGTYALLIVIALALGMVGDALLSVDPFFKGENKKRNIVIAFVIGAVAFLAGHVIYIIAFIKELKNRNAFNLTAFLITLAVIFSVALIIKTFLKVKLGKLTFPILLYGLGLASMGALSICLALFGFKGEFALQAVLTVAPLLFIVSDSSLALRITEKERFDILNVRYVTLITYYSAQMLFAFSVLLMK